MFVTSCIAVILGCAKLSSVVARSDDEFVPRKPDTEWFTRDIYDAGLPGAAWRWPESFVFGRRERFEMVARLDPDPQNWACSNT